MSAPRIEGPITNRAASPAPDPDRQLDESDGVFLFADARDAARWSGLRTGPRWKTWCLGQVTELPIQWPRFDRFHATEAAAEGARRALRDAISRSIDGAVFEPPPNPIGNHPQSAFDVLYVRQPDGTAAGPLGVIMKEVCSDHDYAMHAVHGLGGVAAGNLDGPRMVGYRPPPSRCTVATIPALHARADHVFVVFSPGGADVREALASKLPQASADGHDEVTLDLPSGVLTLAWSTLDGAALLAPFGPDPAMGLATGPLSKAIAAPLSSGSDVAARLDTPAAWAVLVNPGRWTARYLFQDTADGAGLSLCVLSRDGAAPWRAGEAAPDVGVAVRAAGATAKARATDMATDMGRDLLTQQAKALLPSVLWPLIPGQGGSVADNVQARASRWLWSAVTGLLISAAFFVVFAVAITGFVVVTALAVMGVI